MKLKELLEKAFDAGYNTSVMYNCGDGNAYDNFESFYRNEIKQLTLTDVGGCLSDTSTFTVSDETGDNKIQLEVPKDSKQKYTIKYNNGEYKFKVEN